MIKGIGIDITEIDRLKDTKILKKVFLPNEITWAEDNPTKLAILWSIKEAVVKAIGTGFRENIMWQDIEVLPTQNSYIVDFSQKTKKHYNIENDIFHISVSCSNQIVFAQVIQESTT